MIWVISMYETFLRKRLVELRMKKGVSARDMSLSFGQSESYINKIENGKALPSMELFFYICDYFDLRPSDFFEEERESMIGVNELLSTLAKLDEETIGHLTAIISKLGEKQKTK